MDSTKIISYSTVRKDPTPPPSPSQYRKELLNTYDVLPGSLFDLTVEKFYSNGDFTRDSETGERLIRTIWFHLYQLRRSEYSTKEYYSGLVERFQTNTLTAADKDFFARQQQGWVPSAKALGMLFQFVAVPPNASDADIRWTSHYRVETVSGAQWDSLPDGAWRRTVVHIQKSPRFRRNTDPEKMPEDTTLPKERDVTKHDPYLLLVPRSGSIFDTDGVFDCPIILLAMEKIETMFYEYIEPDERRTKSDAMTQVWGNPVHYDLVNHEFYIENNTSGVFRSVNSHTVPRGEMEHYGGTYAERVKLFGKQSQNNQKVKRMYETYYWALDRTLYRAKYPLNQVMGMDTFFEQFVPMVEHGYAWTEKPEEPQCKYPFDMYLLHFDTLENNPELRWLYFLLRYQQMWRARQEHKHSNLAPGKRTLDIWPGLLGPHYNEYTDITFGRIPPPHPDFIDKSTATDERIQERPKRLLAAPMVKTTRRQRRKY